MAVTATPVFPQTPKSSKVQILNADASNLKTAYTGGSNGTKITGLIATSTDTTARDVQVGITNTAVFYILYTVTVPIGAGTVAGTPPVDLLNIVGLPIDNDGQKYLYLSSASDTLQVKSLTTVTAAKEIDVNAIGSDF